MWHPAGTWPKQEKEFCICMIEHSKTDRLMPMIGWYKKWSKGPFWIVPHSPEENEHLGDWRVIAWMKVPAYKRAEGNK